MTRPKLLLKKSYLAMIKNSEGTRLFRDFFGKIKGKEENLTKNGRRSCAFFVSSVLYCFGLIKGPHLTVEGLLKDMKGSGWFKVKRPKAGRQRRTSLASLRGRSGPKAGSIILWEKKQGRSHLGFYLKKQKAISNDKIKKIPLIHHLTFNGERKIKAIFWHKKLNSYDKSK